MAFTAGATPRVDGELVLVGRIGAELNFDEATRALEIATRNAVGSLLGVVATDRVEQVLQMTVYLRCVETFRDHTRLADAASRVLVDAFGQGGLPARTVVGVSSLPAGAAVEVSIVAAIKTG
jgi:enamine deaminase RidA (YjgF/YER057c/UK114 family)